MPASAGQPGCRVWLYPSVEAEARGWAAARRGEFRMEERKTGRGERSGPDTLRVKVRIAANRTEPVSRRSA